MRVKPSTILK
jgi:hypothetical protein